MAAPTLVASVQITNPWSQTPNIFGAQHTKDYPSALSTVAGDLIVVAQGGADSAVSGTLTVGDGVNTYTQRTNIQSANHCSLNIATAPAAADGSRTLTLSRSISVESEIGGIAFQFRDHGGVGNVLTAIDGVQTGNLTCSANSAIIVLCLDWGAVSGTRTWANINGAAPAMTFGVNGDAATWAAAGAYFADVGAAGSKTITLSAPNFTVESFAAIEILAGAGGGSPNNQRGTTLGAG